MLGAIHMVACLMPSVCVMICGGPGAQPASSYACFNPLKGVSPLHASNRPSGWPAAVMRKNGLLPEGLPLRARARSSIAPEYPTGMRWTRRSSRWTNVVPAKWFPFLLGPGPYFTMYCR